MRDVGTATQPVRQRDEMLEPRVELWERKQIVGDDTDFRYMVWHPDGTLEGDCHWFTADEEEEARATFERLGRRLT